MEGDSPPKIAPGRSPLGCALHWLSTSNTAPFPLSTLVAELAAAFGVHQAGVAELPGGGPVAGLPENGPFPWRERPALLGEVVQSPVAVGVRGAGAHWLLTTVGAEDGVGWLLWLHAPAAHEWLP